MPPRISGIHARALRLAAAAAVAALWAPYGAETQSARALPFSPGEECVYRASGPLGRIGTGTMGVDAAGQQAGRSAWLLRFDFRGRLGPLVAEDRTRSWVDPVSMATLRYTKRERTPVSSATEDVWMDLASGRWRGADGRGGALPTEAPLDELSFIYFLRTLRLAEGDSYTFTRHYEADRNPVLVRVVGREVLRVPAGEFNAIAVEMRVKDRDRYGDSGLVRLHFSDDARRIPLRIESTVPRVGRLVMTLQEGSDGCVPSRGAMAGRN